MIKIKLVTKTKESIEALDESKMKKVKERLDNLTKPPGSLGYLEDLAIRLAGISKSEFLRVDKKEHIIMVGDHGVVKEGVSAFPQSITKAMVENFLNGGAAVNVLAKQFGVNISIVDIGMVDHLNKNGVINLKIKNGTDNFLKGPAMSYQEAVLSVEKGIKITNQLIKNGVDILGTGEMGIGNTTPSSAIIAVVTGKDVEEVVGYGTGIDQKGLNNKIEVIKEALRVNNPSTEDGLDLLSKVGGLEIGGMAGIMLAGAAGNKPVMVDGLISGAAALIAYLIEPKVINYLIPSHKSVEPGHKLINKHLDLKPIFDLNMRLGEGTGSVIGISIVESAVRILNEMATFDTLDF